LLYAVTSWYDTRLQSKANRAAPLRVDKDQTHYGVRHNPDPKAYMLAERKNSTVATAVARVSDAVMRLPLRVMEVEVEDGKERFTPDDNHPGNEFLQAPNPYNDIAEIKVHEVQSLMLAGNSYLGMELDGSGQPTEFWPIESHRTRLVPDEQGMPTKYEYTVDQAKRVSYDLTEICHARIYNCNDPFYGRSRIEPAHSELLTTHYARQYNKNFFKNDATPGGMIFPKEPGSVDAEEAKRLMKEWRATYGADNKFAVGMMTFPAQFQAFTPPLKDLAFLDLLKLDREQLLAVLGTPPALAGIYEYANYANSDIQKKLFWENAVLPILAVIEAAFNRQIMHRFYDRDHVYKHDLTGVQALQEDEKVRAETDAILVRANIVTVNEVRAERDLDPVEWGDEPISPMGMLQLDGETPKPEDQGGGKAEPGLAVPSYHHKVSSPDYNQWKAFDGEVTRHEIAFSRIMVKFFMAQRDRVIKGIREVTGEGAAMSQLHWIAKSDPDDIPEDASRIFNLRSEDAVLSRSTLPYVRETIGDAGQALLDSHAIDMAFNVHDPNVSLAIDSFWNQIRNVNDTSYKKIQALLNEAYDGGWTITELEKQLRKTFKQFSKTRSVLIARTEMSGVVNGGTFQGRKQAGIEKHQWLSTRAANTRDTHIHVDGEIVEVGKPFTRLSWPMLYPGDPSGPASEVCNCRCTTISVIE